MIAARIEYPATESGAGEVLSGGFDRSMFLHFRGWVFRRLVELGLKVKK